MKSKLNLTLIAFLIMGAVTMVSCKKEGSQQGPAISDEESLVLSEENTTADAEFDDIAEIGLSAGADLEGAASLSTEIPGSAAGGIVFSPDFFQDLKFKVGPCTTIEVSPNDSTFPKTVLINYGDGCICRDGKFRKGAVLLHFTGPIRRPGSVLTITLRNYFVNRVHFEGTKTVKNLSEGGVHKYASHIEDGKVSWPSGRGFRYEGSKVVTQLQGMETRTVRDDVYSIVGRNKTVYANGTVVVKNTESPLIKPVACNWIVKGILKVSINSRVIFIDYGNGDCDNKAMLQWAGGQKEIRLPW